MKITLDNGNNVSVIGFGTYKITDEKELNSVLPLAIKNGYDFIDTAYYYKNENLISKTLKNHSIDRKNLTIATKVWPSDFGYDATMYSIERSLKALYTDYIDILYLHWPGDDMEYSWRAFERMNDEKVVKNLAISNFFPEHYEFLMKNANIKPVINQLEIHPYNQSDDIVDYYMKENVKLIAWSPIARANAELFSENTILSLCEKYGKSQAQVILRWHIQSGRIVIPKTKSENRVIENIDIFDFELEKEEMNEIKKLNKNKNVSKSPKSKEWLNEIRDKK